MVQSHDGLNAYSVQDIERKAVFLWKLIFKTEDPLMQEGLMKVLSAGVEDPWVYEIKENVVNSREIYD